MMLKIDRKKINELLEFAVLVILFFLGIKKGGYYKQDSIVLVFLVQFVIAIKFFFNYRGVKKDNILSLLLLIFSLAYMLPLIFGNCATVSGSINFISRMYTLFLIFCFVQNTENKEQFKNAIIIFTILVGVFGVDEIGLKLFDRPLKLIGSGYLEEENTRISSVIQYSNLVGLLSMLSTIFILEKIINKEKSVKEENIKEEKKSIILDLALNLAVVFLGMVIFLTQSKMSMLLYLIATIVYLIMNKKYSKILGFITCYIISFGISLTNSWILVLMSIIAFAIYYLLVKNCAVLKKKETIINIGIIILVIGIFALNLNYIKGTETVTRFREYFERYISTKIRNVYYKDAFNIWNQDIKTMLFGMGGNAFRTMYETTQYKFYVSLEAHGLWIQVLLESGLIGLITLMSIVTYTMFKGKDKTAKFVLLVLLIFTTFDIYITYSYMLFMFGIILALCEVETKEAKNSHKLLLGITLVCMLIFNFKICLGYIIAPVEVDNANNSLQKQEQVIKRCELGLMFDPYDLLYIENYVNACKTYLNIMDIRKELYAEDDIQKRVEIVDKMYQKATSMLKYERENKYVEEDVINVVCKYVDYLVMKNYDVNILEGYEYYLEKVMVQVNRLEENHKFNKLAIQMHQDAMKNVYNKYSEVNLLLHSDKIQDILDTIKEKENINL